MTAAAGVRMKCPAHPGGFVKHEIIEPHGLSVTDTARARGVTRPALSALANERTTLSPEMALRLEKAFGVPIDTLMRMQNSYGIAQARGRNARSMPPASLAIPSVHNRCRFELGNNRYFRSNKRVTAQSPLVAW
jgi:antitoxin HigA-1